MLNEERPLLAKRWPEMAAKIQKRLLSEGKITKEMIENYVDAYAGIYGDDTDAYVEEIVADTYAGMNRTGYGTNQLRADVKMEVGQWQKKSSSARAPPVKMSIAQDFKSRVAEWYKSGMPEGTSFVLGETGATLQGLGAIESDIYMNGEKISTILKEHPEMTIREIQRIPEILDDPVLILKSKNNARSQYGNSRLVMFGAIKAQDGRNIMCVLDLRPTEKGLLIDDMQKVSSAYSKDVAPENFIKRSFILFADEKRTIPLLRGMGFKMPMSLLRNGSIGSISYEGKSVNLRGEKFSDVVSVETTAETAKRKFSASADQAQTGQQTQQEDEKKKGRYRDLMGEKAAKYTKGILCAYRKIKKSLSKTGEGFLYRCTIIPITPFTKTMRSDKDTSGTPETIRTSDPSLRRRMLYPAELQRQIRQKRRYFFIFE